MIVLTIFDFEIDQDLLDNEYAEFHVWFTSNFTGKL